MFEDPYHNLEFGPTLLELWNADVTEEAIQLKPEELSEVLNNVHHKINLGKENGLKSGSCYGRIYFSISLSASHYAQ